MGLQHNSGGSSHCVGLIFKQLLHQPTTVITLISYTAITEKLNYLQRGAILTGEVRIPLRVDEYSHTLLYKRSNGLDMENEFE